MTDAEWAIIEQLLGHGWSAPGKWTDATASAYRLVLDNLDGAQVLLAVQRLIQSGNRFRPSIAEVVAATSADPGLPTWAEAYKTIFAPGGITWAPDRERDTHEVIDLFVETQGLDRCGPCR